MEGSNDVRTVFLSSTARDLYECREAAYHAIEGLDGYHCVRMEDFGARDALATDFCRDRVKQCALFVGIVGLCYGSSPECSDKSYTELEYETALAVGIPCLMFVAPEDLPVPVRLFIDDGNWEQQESFRKRVNREHIRDTFSSPDELAGKVVTAIRNWERKQSSEPADALRPISVPNCVDCIILCGGYARRLWPLTSNLA